jgi:hypothetical protein
MPNILSRPYSSATLVCFMTIPLVFFSTGCSSPSNGDHKSSSEPITTEPSQADLVQAVRNSVNGKTYSRTSTASKPVMRYERRAHFCSQLDVDRDPYMPRNPELAKCPRVGHTYWTNEPVTETEPQTVTETLRCPTLPGPEFGWSVVQVSDDTWQVSVSGSTWDVTKVDGGAVGVPGVVRVSKFTFTIKPHQDC